MTRALTATALLSIALLAPLGGTPTGASSDPPLQIADLAWERGDYPTALAGYLRLLDSPDAAVLEPIALRTGELYATTELTRDGALPQFSPDGRYLHVRDGPGRDSGNPRDRDRRAGPCRRRTTRRRCGVLARRPEGGLLEAHGSGNDRNRGGPAGAECAAGRARDHPRSRQRPGDLARQRAP